MATERGLDGAEGGDVVTGEGEFGVSTGSQERGSTLGVLISFEGLDGSGKSTQLELLADELRGIGLDVVTTREPGGTRVGEAVRDILLSPVHTEMAARTEALLYAAARAQLVEEVVRPALERGAVVLTDRYLDSSIAYQGFGRQLGLDDIITLSVWATECLFPELTLFYRVLEEERSRRSVGVVDRLEAEDSDFFSRVEAGYVHMAEVHGHRIREIDASGSVGEVYGRTRAAVDEEFGWLTAAAAAGSGGPGAQVVGTHVDEDGSEGHGAV